MKKLALVMLLIAGSGVARADGPKTKADAAFDEAISLRAKGKEKEACDKFAEALRYDERAIGSILNLALCAEKDNKLATAVRLYSEARDRAHEQNLKAFQDAAEEHIAVLTPQLSHVTVKLAETLPGTKVLIDDRVVAIDALSNIAVDAGDRTIQVTAPDHLPYVTKVSIGLSKDLDVPVPALAKAVVVSSHRRIGQLMTLGGGVIVASGVIVGFVARSRYNAQFDAHTDDQGTTYFPCSRTTNRCTPDGHTQTENARTLGLVGTVIGGAGIVAVGVGAVLWITAKSEEKPPASSVAIVPTITPSQLGFTVQRTF